MKLRIRLTIRIFRRDSPKDLATKRQNRTKLSLLTVTATGFWSQLPEEDMFSICFISTGKQNHKGNMQFCFWPHVIIAKAVCAIPGAVTH